MVVSVLLNSFAQLFLKKGVTGVQGISLSLGSIVVMLRRLALNGYIWCGFLCYALSIVLWLVVLSQVEVSEAYPFLSIGYIVTLFLGFLLFGESLTLHKILGVILILAGIISIARGL